MAGANLAFSKVVATPTPNAWSQAYSAGSLFAALSLESNSSALETDLGNIGKDLISTLESEFFTLERKDLESIKEAIATTVAKVNDEIKFSFVVCYLNENILYLYAAGAGKAVLKRGEKIGTVLEGEDGQAVKSASGYVQSGDIIILQTKQFIRIIASSTLASSLDKSIPEEIAEELAPHVHDKSEGGASAVILLYKEGHSEVIPEVKEAMEQAAADTTTTAPEEPIQQVTENTVEETSQTPEQISNPAENTETISNIETAPEEISEIIRPNQPVSKTAPIESPQRITYGSESDNEIIPQMPQKSRKKMSVGLGPLTKFSRSKKLILLVGIILVIVIIIVSALAIINKKNSNNQELFQGIYTEAKDNYDEGISLRDLNASLSEESFKKAQDILEQNKDTFSEGSNEDNQIEDLLSKVNNELGGSSDSNNDSSSTASEVDKSESKLLSAELDNSGATYFTQNDDFIYFLDSKGINKIDKGNDEKETVTKKDWDEEGGIGVFGSNIYVLDKANNVLKFVPSGNDYSNSNYFSGDVPNLEDSAAMGIDGSVYILGKDGSIKKYTRGAEDDFSVTGLEKPLSSPTRIWTTEDQDNIYILDRGNSRIVVLGKDGKFVKAYGADIVKNAKDIDVQEKDKKIYVLSGDKIYKIDLN